MRTGDQLVAIDGLPIETLDAARRRLRRAFVLGGAELSVERAGRPLRMTVSFFGWELPKVGAQLDLLASLDRTTLDMRDSWF